MEQKTVVFVVCDALRWDYLNEKDSPYILNLIEKGIYVKKIRTSLGFCERTEMFTGTRPEDSGYFTALTFDKEKSDFGKLSDLDLKFLKFLKVASSIVGSFSPFLGKVINYVVIDNFYLKKLSRHLNI